MTISVMANSITGEIRHSDSSSWVYALDTLAEEVYPALSPENAREKFRDLARVAQVTGERSKMLLPIKAALGPRAVRFLAQIEHFFDNNHNQLANDSLALQLFVDAGLFPEPVRSSVRGKILDAFGR